MNFPLNQMNFRIRMGLGISLGIALAATLSACQSEAPAAAGTAATVSNGSGAPSPTQVGASQASAAVCGAGSKPETGLQGQVPLADRQSGRSQQGYSCNMELVGQYQGEGATWVNPSYSHCAYMGTTFTGILQKKSQGVQVVDVSNPSKPVLSTNLTSPAFLQSPWESMKVNEKRGLLAGVAVGPVVSAGFFDIYDISKDCAKPVLLNSLAGNFTLPANVIGHEGAWSPDGNTYWSTGLNPGSVTAIDVKDPKNPRVIYFGVLSFDNHGFELSEDGNRMYLTTKVPSGIIVLDTSAVQSRKTLPMITQIGSVTWEDGGTTQHSIPVSYLGKPYLLAVDEGGAGAARFIDISDETKPKEVSKLKLAIHAPENADIRAADTANNGTFGYEGHYCQFDKKVDPTAVACGYIQSGVRVFDVRNPLQPKEIAYFNPPAQTTKKAMLKGSEHATSVIGATADLSTDWCTSPPRFVGPDQLWVTCQDNGFMVLKFTNGAYPL